MAAEGAKPVPSVLMTALALFADLVLAREKAAGGRDDLPRYHGLVVLRQKTRCLFLVNLLTQYGHLGSVLAIATIKY